MASVYQQIELFQEFIQFLNQTDSPPHKGHVWKPDSQGNVPSFPQGLRKSTSGNAKSTSSYFLGSEENQTWCNPRNALHENLECSVSLILFVGWWESFNSNYDMHSILDMQVQVLIIFHYSTSNHSLPLLSQNLLEDSARAVEPILFHIL